MSFSNHLRKLAQPVWDAQLTHPFVLALGKGTLSERKFRYYILQDARFLADLARVFAAGSVRAPDAESAPASRTGRRYHHRRAQPPRELREALESLPQDMLNEPMAPTNYAYTRHMLTVAQSGTATGNRRRRASPAWIYCVVGKHLPRMALHPPSTRIETG